MVSAQRLFWIARFGGLILAGVALGFGGNRIVFATQPPNVVMFLTDDLGWTDWQYDASLNPTGSAVYETPNLLQLAHQSMVFNNAYAACPLCSPTRASILTGQSPARIGMTNIVGNTGVTSATLREPASYVQNLPASQITLAESLKAAGYSTGLFGKWHLGSDANNAGSQPLQNGFDVNVGGNNYGGPDFAGGFFAGSDGCWAGMPGLDIPGTYPADKYLSDAVSEKVGAFIQQNASAPFFLANWDFLVHIPIQAPQNLVTKYQTKINTLQSQGVDLKGHTNATYAAMVEKMDQSLGNILHRLDDPNLDGNTSDSIRNNTILLFLSDNGGVWAPGGEGALTRNLPLREGKGSIYEGGIRVPQLISWTGDPNIPQGTVSSARTSTYDLYPTLLDLTGLGSSVPQNAVVDGVDFRTALEGGSFDRGLLYWHYPHRSNQSLGSSSITGGSFVSAVADKAWKLIFFYDDRHYELYNLTADVGETTNLLAYNPAIAHDLSLALQNYLVSLNAQMPRDKTTLVPVALPPVTSVTIPGDYNGDGVVNTADYSYWRANFGSIDHLAADGNRNGIVDTADYVFWRKIYISAGSGSFSGGLAAVPEPAAALLFGIGLISLATVTRGRRHRHLFQ
jgi:arylsulfatase A-like enzyme